MEAALAQLGATSMGAVAALIVVDRIVRERPAGTTARLRFAIWAATLAAGVTVGSAVLGGVGALAWSGAGMAVGALARMALSPDRQGKPGSAME